MNALARLMEADFRQAARDWGETVDAFCVGTTLDLETLAVTESSRRSIVRGIVTRSTAERAAANPSADVGTTIILLLWSSDLPALAADEVWRFRIGGTFYAVTGTALVGGGDGRAYTLRSL